MQKYSPVRLLPEDTIEKISAGEAIERPSSAVKELLENSLDASAGKITIEIEETGKKLIRVCDDGSGIAADDLPKVFLRHTTSKIFRYEDIFDIKTMGFRGEALSSLCAVSALKISSAVEGESGWTVESNFGKLSSAVPSPVEKGSIVEIKNLFYNTPARLKFLKSAASEKKAIIKTVQSIAIANPRVWFILRMDGKEIMNLMPSDMGERIRDVFKKDMFSAMISFIGRNENIEVSGYISGLNGFATTRDFQYIYVNKRNVETRKITHSFYEASRGFLASGRHPAFVLFIETPPSMVDVNVHPTKKEVKFSDENFVFDLTVKSVRESLAAQSPERYYRKEAEREEKSLKETLSEYYDMRGTQGGMVLEEKLSMSGVKYVSEAFDFCIIAKDRENLYLIDTHAAEERVLYEKYKTQAEKTGTGVPTQLLTDSILIDMREDKAHSLCEKSDLLKSLGWRVEFFGENTIRCEGVPTIFYNSSTREILLELISVIKKDGDANADELIKMACRAAVRGKEKLNFIEAQKLLDELFSTPNYQTCPHGRPTIIRITKDELSRKFKR